MASADCHDEESDWYPPENRENWWCESRMGIQETRMLYNSITYYISIWPGPPERPEDEMKYLEFLKSKLFAAIMEYNLMFNEVE